MAASRRSAGDSLRAHDRAFVDLYRGGPDDVRGNAKACYRRLHPRANARTAEVEASKILRKPEVAAYLAERTEANAAAADATERDVIAELARIAFFDVRRLFRADGTPKAINELGDDTAACIQGVDVVMIGNKEVGVGQVLKYKIADKNSALDKLMKHLGQYEADNRQQSPLEGLPPELLEHIVAKLGGTG